MRITRLVLFLAGLLAFAAEAAYAQELPRPNSLFTGAAERQGSLFQAAREQSPTFDVPEIAAIPSAAQDGAFQQTAPVQFDARPFEPERPAALMPLYASLVTLQALDFHSTRSALENGTGIEANPVMKGVVNNSAAFTLVKASSTALTVWAAEKLWKKNRKAAVIFTAAINGLMAVVVTNNYRVAQDR